MTAVFHQKASDLWDYGKKVPVYNKEGDFFNTVTEPLFIRFPLLDLRGDES